MDQEEQDELEQAERWAKNAFGSCKEYVARKAAPMLSSRSSSSTLTPTYSSKGLQLQLSRRGSIVTTCALDAEGITLATETFDKSSHLTAEARQANAELAAAGGAEKERRTSPTNISWGSPKVGAVQCGCSAVCAVQCDAVQCSMCNF